MRWSQVQCFVVGLVTYVHGVSVVLSRTTPTPTRGTNCELAQFNDVESRTVVASVVVDAFVDDLTRVERTSSGVILYHARLTVIHVLKGRLRRSDSRSRSRGLTTIRVGVFARVPRRSGRISTSTQNVDELCASFHLPVIGSRYIVFLQQPTASSDQSASRRNRPVVYNISSSPLTFSVSQLDVIRRCSRRKYRM